MSPPKAPFLKIAAGHSCTFRALSLTTCALRVNNAMQCPRISLTTSHSHTHSYDEKNYKVALSRYNEIVKLAPHIPDAFINLGNINEALQKYDAAADAYKETMEREPNNVKGYNAMCRLLLMEVSGVAVGRFGVSRARRLEAFNEAKRYCMEAVQVCMP